MITLTIILILIIGLLDGFIEFIKHHYSKLKIKFPKLNDNFWNPNISWKNKWKEDLKTERFFLSSRTLVFLTDAYHLFRMILRQTIFLTIAINLDFNLMLSIISMNIIFIVGFYIIYK